MVFDETFKDAKAFNLAMSTKNLLGSSYFLPGSFYFYYPFKPHFSLDTTRSKYRSWILDGGKQSIYYLRRLSVLPR